MSFSGQLMAGTILGVALLSIPVVTGPLQAGRTFRARIVMPDGAASSNVRVKLENNLGETIREGYTESTGIFEVAHLGIGSYVLIVPTDDHTYETATEQIDVNRYSPDTIQVSVYLSPKKTEAASRKKDRRTISAAEAESHVPKKALEAYHRASSLSKHGKLQEAIKELEFAISIYPSYLQAYNDMGLGYLKLDRVEDALRSLAKAAALDPKSFNPQLNLGIAYMRMQDFQSAEPHLRRALSSDSSSGIAHMYLGILLGKTGKPEVAEDEMLRALSLGGPDLAIAHYYLGQFYIARDRITEAILELEAYLKEKPDAEDAKRARDELADLRARQK